MQHTLLLHSIAMDSRVFPGFGCTCVLIFLAYITRNAIAGSFGVAIFNFTRSYKLFQIACTPSSCVGGVFQSLHVLTCTCEFRHYGGEGVDLIVVFMCISPITRTQTAFYIFISHLDFLPCILPIKCLASFSIESSVFLVIICGTLKNIFWISALCQFCFPECFSQLVAFFLISSYYLLKNLNALK